MIEKAALKPVIVKGDWDKSKVLFEETVLFNSFRQHFVYGLPWGQTRYYRQLISGCLKTIVRKTGGPLRLLEKYGKKYEKIGKRRFCK